jgi:antitoxin component YwqK of YwqJK toxin-antitoxin module
MKKDIINKNEKNQLHGIQIGYYNDQIHYKHNYINGKQHGEQILYYENDQIRYKHYYKKYYINGSEVSQEEYLAYDRRSKLDIIKDL